MVNGQFGGMNFTAGVGFFPSLFGLQFVSNSVLIFSPLFLIEFICSETASLRQ